jgi:hypothetical protein
VRQGLVPTRCDRSVARSRGSAIRRHPASRRNGSPRPLVAPTPPRMLSDRRITHLQRRHHTRVRDSVGQSARAMTVSVEREGAQRLPGTGPPGRDVERA